MDRIRPIDTTEEIIENLTDPEASAIFREAFYAEAKALEKEALANPVEVDEEQMEALRRRILQSVGAEAEDTEALEKEAEGTPADAKRKKHRFSPLVSWAAVLALAFMGVFGMSMTSQAKGSGLWSSIQRLIGVETRWAQEDNGEDRTYSNPEEYKAISEIEDKLGILVPTFFYWPEGLEFLKAEIFTESNSFVIAYVDGEQVIYFEGWKGERDASSNNTWQGEGKTIYEEYDNIIYEITEVKNDVYSMSYYVKWTNGEMKYFLSGMTDLEELENILKNIKK